MPWSYVLFGVLFVSLVLFGLFLAGLAPFWVAVPCIPAMVVAYVVWDKKTDETNDTWGEGARGEVRVGRELERLHEQGFHVFHDWDSGRGNVDHFVVGPTGVFAVETKAWTGKITAEGGRLARNGFVLRGKDDPMGQARENAKRVNALVARSSGVRAYVTPVLCFTKAEVSFYGQVRNGEVTSLGSLNRVVADPNRPRLQHNGWEGYSPQEVRAISHCLEKKLGVAPAAAPGSPPEEPSRASRILDRVVALPTSTVALAVLGVAFLVSLLFPERTSKVLLGLAYLYHLLARATSNLF